MSNPTNAHLNFAKHVLRFIKSSLNYELKFVKSSVPLKLASFCDSDWGGEIEDRHSMSGFGYQLSTRVPLISWKSKITTGSCSVLM